MDEHEALEYAIEAAQQSPCIKSQRGVVIWRRDVAFPIGSGFNHPPSPFVCGRNLDCRQQCGKLCIHAEEDAILKALDDRGVSDFHILHVRVVDGKAVPSGPPSCWQCSRTILQLRFKAVWLLHEDGLKAYSPEEFHQLTLENESLPVFKMM
jgi:deoxycytidylate deaminase